MILSEEVQSRFGHLRDQKTGELRLYGKEWVEFQEMYRRGLGEQLSPFVHFVLRYPDPQGQPKEDVLGTWFKRDWERDWVKGLPEASVEKQHGRFADSYSAIFPVSASEAFNKRAKVHYFQGIDVSFFPGFGKLSINGHVRTPERATQGNALKSFGISPQQLLDAGLHLDLRVDQPLRPQLPEPVRRLPPGVIEGDYRIL